MQPINHDYVWKSKEFAAGRRYSRWFIHHFPGNVQQGNDDNFFFKYRYCVSNHSDMGGLVLVGTYHTFVDDEFSEKCLCIVSIIYRRFDVTVVVVVVVADGVFQRLWKKFVGACWRFGGFVEIMSVVLSYFFVCDHQIINWLCLEFFFHYCWSYSQYFVWFSPKLMFMWLHYFRP